MNCLLRKIFSENNKTKISLRITKRPNLSLKNISDKLLKLNKFLFFELVYNLKIISINYR